MTKPKAINRKKLVAFVLPILRTGGISHAQKKKPQTLQELYAAKEETENELRKAKQKEKILQNQISKLTRNDRTHRLCTRAGMLESFLPNPELLRNEEVMAVESEARKPLTE